MTIFLQLGDTWGAAINDFCSVINRATNYEHYNHKFRSTISAASIVGDAVHAAPIFSNAASIVGDASLHGTRDRELLTAESGI